MRVCAFFPGGPRPRLADVESLGTLADAVHSETAQLCSSPRVCTTDAPVLAPALHCAALPSDLFVLRTRAGSGIKLRDAHSMRSSGQGLDSHVQRDVPC